MAQQEALAGPLAKSIRFTLMSVRVYTLECTCVKSRELEKLQETQDISR